MITRKLSVIFLLICCNAVGMNTGISRAVAKADKIGLGNERCALLRAAAHQDKKSFKALWREQNQDELNQRIKADDDWLYASKKFSKRQWYKGIPFQRMNKLELRNALDVAVDSRDFDRLAIMCSMMQEDDIKQFNTHFSFVGSETDEVVAIIDFLVSRGASLNKRTAYKPHNTMLIEACKMGAVEIVGALLRSDKIDVHYANADKETALTIAYNQGNVAIIALLDSDYLKNIEASSSSLSFSFLSSLSQEDEDEVEGRLSTGEVSSFESSQKEDVKEVEKSLLSSSFLSSSASQEDAVESECEIVAENKGLSFWEKCALTGVIVTFGGVMLHTYFTHKAPVISSTQAPSMNSVQELVKNCTQPPTKNSTNASVKNGLQVVSTAALLGFGTNPFFNKK